MQRRIVIIGGGISGMTAAVLLGSHGFPVTIVEKNPFIGTTMRGFLRKGVYFDTALHYVGSLAGDGALGIYLRHLGLAGLRPIPFDPNGFDELRYTASGDTFRLPIGYDAARNYLHAQFPDEKAAVSHYLETICTLYRASPFLNPGGDLSVHHAHPAESESLASYLNGLTQNQLLRSVLSAHALLYGVAPENVALSHHAHVVGSYMESVHTFDGGGLAVVKAFEQRLDALNIDIRCGDGVKSLRFSSNGVLSGVLLEQGGTLDATDIVCTAHPSVLLDIVPESFFRPAFRRRIASLTETLSAYILYGISAEPLHCLERRNLFIFPQMDVSSCFQPDHMPTQGPFYITASQNPHSTADDGRRSVTVIAPASLKTVERWVSSHLGTRPEEYRHYKQDMTDAIQQTVCSLCPELSAVRFVERATPLTLRDYMYSTAGGLYGCQHSLLQSSPHPVTRIPGLWLAGQSVTAPGILGAMISAYLCCGHIIGPDVIRKEVRACLSGVS